MDIYIYSNHVVPYTETLTSHSHPGYVRRVLVDAATSLCKTFALPSAARWRGRERMRFGREIGRQHGQRYTQTSDFTTLGSEEPIGLDPRT